MNCHVYLNPHSSSWLPIRVTITLPKEVAMNEKLRIKFKTLAAEARFIRLEENKTKKYGRLDECASLHNHRTNEVRKEARHSLLAYGFLRGTPYAKIERFSYSDPNWFLTLKIVRRFADTTELLGDNKPKLEERFDEWRKIKETELPEHTDQNTP